MTQHGTGDAADVATQLRMILAARRISGRRLAELTGLSAPMIARTLRGDRDLTVPELRRVCDALALDPADLLTVHPAGVAS
jgi:transcriptional regulator with XRE-family HTH domain